jgi:hypothetical protein
MQAVAASSSSQITYDDGQLLAHAAARENDPVVAEQMNRLPKVVFSQQ